MPTAPTPGTLELDEQPGETLDDLWTSDPKSAEHVEAALDTLDRDPGSAANRRRRIRGSAGGPLWGIDIRCGDSDLLILWEADDGTVVVRYLGPTLRSDDH